MNKKKAILAACAVLGTAAIGAGAYWAWVEGHIPASYVTPHPRAPLPENFLATLQGSAAVAQMLRPSCARLSLYTGREIDRMGRPGLQHQRVPGWDVMTIAQVPGDGNARIGNLTQVLDALVQAKFYAVSDSEIDDGNGGKLPSRTYVLTPAGWGAQVDDQCFQIGTPRITDIAEYSRVMPDRDGKRVYEVKAHYATPEFAPWVGDPSVQSMISKEQLKRFREPSSINVRLLRTDTGWAVDGPDAEVPGLTPQVVLDLVAKWRGGIPPQACIRLPGKGSVRGFEVVTAPYAATLYDEDPPGEATDPRYAQQRLWQARFVELVKAGVFKAETVAANPRLNAPSGTRFVLEAGYQAWLDMNDGRCLRFGDTAMEVVGFSVHRQMKPDGNEARTANATARLRLVLKNSWADPLGLSLPELDAIKAAGGLPITVRLSWSDRDKEKEWRVGSVQVPPSEPVPPRLPRSAQARSAPTAAPAPLAVPAPYTDGVRPGAPASAGSRPAMPSSAGEVTWRSGDDRWLGGRVTQQGLTVTYCCAGASSTSFASKTVTTGRYYAEFAFTARPLALEGDTWTTIGVLPGDGKEQKAASPAAQGIPTMAFKRGNEIAHNDVIGIAIDLDRGRLYFSRNGVWMNGAPGSEGGLSIARGQPHTIAAVLSASSSSIGTDRWTANFGKTRFRYGLPRGYQSYDGRQRG